MGNCDLRHKVVPVDQGEFHFQIAEGFFRARLRLLFRFAFCHSQSLESQVRKGLKGGMMIVRASVVGPKLNVE
jgi:hypothetical protein